MGRGGPAEPELVATPPTLDELVALSRAGRHAASDHLETAALAGVPTIGCRRAGGGMAGAPFASNVLEGAGSRRRSTRTSSSSTAAARRSRRSRPTARILVAHDLSRPEPVSRADQRPRADSVRATDCRAPRCGCARGRSTGASRSSRRAPRRSSTSTRTSCMCRAISPTASARRGARALDADTYLVELKAAAIDVVAEHALERGASSCSPTTRSSRPGLDEASSGSYRSGSRMTEPRRIMPLPLGGEHGLPYSRGLMARALMAVGVAPERAYALARTVGDDLAERGERRRRARPARVARGRDRSARSRAARRCDSCAATRSCASSTCRS